MLKSSFGPVQVLRGLNLNAEEHQVLCLIGPSGCGKSTLLRCINQLEPIQAGEIRLEGDRVSGPGVDVNRLRQQVGIVFQSFNLFPHMNVLENVTLAPTQSSQTVTSDEAESRAMALAQAHRHGPQGQGLSRTGCPAGSSSAWPLCAHLPWNRS